MWSEAQTTMDRFGQTLAHISLSDSWNNFWRHFAVLPLSASPPWPAVHAWRLPESCLLSPASFQLTVDCVIELKRGDCSHSLRSFRRSGETFLHVKKKNNNNKKIITHFLLLLSLFFSHHPANPFRGRCEPRLVLKSGRAQRWSRHSSFHKKRWKTCTQSDRESHGCHARYPSGHQWGHKEGVDSDDYFPPPWVWVLILSLWPMHNLDSLRISIFFFILK